MTGDSHGILETGGTETCIESRSQVWHPKACNVHATSLAHMYRDANSPTRSVKMVLWLLEVPSSSFDTLRYPLVLQSRPKSQKRLGARLGLLPDYTCRGLLRCFDNVRTFKSTTCEMNLRPLLQKRSLVEFMAW